jgi:sugar phosphate isomerase/epimerase
MALRHPFAIQLYSGRKFPPLESQVAVAAGAGFTHVETFGPLNDSPGETRRALDRHGLSAVSTHVSRDTLEGDTGGALAAARTLGVEFVVAPYLPPERRPNDRAGWAALGEQLARCRDTVERGGLRFAWHNHDFEFALLPDGSYPIEHVLGVDLAWEADLAWVTRGGADPMAWIDRYRGRIPLVHVKDVAAAGTRAEEDGWADVGEGVLPWPSLWSACVAAGAEVMIAEHDNPSDFDRFARVSGSAMRTYAQATPT